MIIEINKDIDRYKETVIMGLTARQLIFSVLSVLVGGGVVSNCLYSPLHLKLNLSADSTKVVLNFKIGKSQNLQLQSL